MYKVDHFAFFVADMDRAIAFYRDVLGLKLLSRDVDEEHGEEFSFLELEGGNLELLSILPSHRDKSAPKQDLSNPKSRGYSPHLALTATDLGGLVEKFKKLNVPILEEPLLIPGKVTWMYITDPDGNIIEFVEWLK